MVYIYFPFSTGGKVKTLLIKPNQTTIPYNFLSWRFRLFSRPSQVQTKDIEDKLLLVCSCSSYSIDKYNVETSCTILCKSCNSVVFEFSLKIQILHTMKTQMYGSRVNSSLSLIISRFSVLLLLRFAAKSWMFQPCFKT